MPLPRVTLSVNDPAASGNPTLNMRTRPPRTPIRFALWSLALTVASSSVAAHAAETPADAAKGSAPARSDVTSQSAPDGSTATTQVTEGFHLEIHELPAGFDEAALRQAIDAEVGAATGPAPKPGESLSLRFSSATTVEVTWYAADGRSRGRRLALPEDPQRAIDTIALLASNLRRDESQELLESLRPSTPAQASAAPQPEPPPPAASAQPSAPTRPGQPEPLAQNIPANLALFHPIGLAPQPERRRFVFDLGILYSRSGAVSGLALSGGLSQLDRGLRGLQVAAVGAYSAGDTRGLVVGGMGGITQGRLLGTNAGGLFALQLGEDTESHRASFARGASVIGGSFAGLWSHTAGGMQGLQVSGLAASTTGDFTGLQLAPVGWLGGTARGLQLGVVNLSTERLVGSQISVVNVAAQLDGAALGVVNVGEQASGVQLGVVNVYERNSGVPIGLFNAGHDTTQQLRVAWSNLYPVNLALHQRTGHTFVELGVAAKRDALHQDEQRPELLPSASFGGSWTLAQRFFVEPSLGYGFHVPTRSSSATERHHVSLARLTVGAQLQPWLALFATGGWQESVATEGAKTQGKAEFMAGAQIF